MIAFGHVRALNALERVREIIDARIGNQHVQLAEPVHGFGDGGDIVVPVAHIPDHTSDQIAMRGDQIVQIGLRAHQNTDARALGHEPVHDGASDPLAPARHEGGISIQTSHQKNVFRFLDSRTFCTMNTRRRSRR